MESEFGLVDPESEALAIVGVDGTIVDVYPHDSLIFDRAACDATRLEELLPERWLAVLLDVIRSTQRTREPSTVELDRKSNGARSPRAVRVRISPGSRGAFVLMRDLTFDPRAELARNTEDDSSFWGLFETAPIALSITTLTSSGSIGPVWINGRFTELFGYTTEDVPTVQHWWPRAYPDEEYREYLRNEWWNRVAIARETGACVEPIEATVTCKDGSTRDIEFGASTIHGFSVVSFVDLTDRNRARRELALRVEELESALAQVKMLRGLLPLCAWCKKVRDDKGYWTRVEEFLARSTDITVTHGICPDCQRTHFGVGSNPR